MGKTPEANPDLFKTGVSKAATKIGVLGTFDSFANHPQVVDRAYPVGQQ